MGNLFLMVDIDQELRSGFVPMSGTESTRILSGPAEQG
jgi:hypothetical protein